MLMQQEYGIQPGTVMNATIAAMIVAKVILLADLLTAVNSFPDKPLIYNIVWKTLIYQAVAILVGYLERLWDSYREAGSLAAANAHMIETVIWPHFWAVQLLMLVLLIQYCTWRELARKLGGDYVHALFLGPLSVQPQPPQSQ
jgi:chromate transport protein ChrA